MHTTSYNHGPTCAGLHITINLIISCTIPFKCGYIIADGNPKFFPGCYYFSSQLLSKWHDPPAAKQPIYCEPVTPYISLGYDRYPWAIPLIHTQKWQIVHTRPFLYTFLKRPDQTSKNYTVTVTHSFHTSGSPRNDPGSILVFWAMPIKHYIYIYTWSHIIYIYIYIYIYLSITLDIDIGECACQCGFRSCGFGS